MDSDESDTDRRGVYLAPTELQWSLFGAPEQFEDNASQSCYWELQKFLTMALKANPNILECLYSSMFEKVTPIGQELLSIREVGLKTSGYFEGFDGLFTLTNQRVPSIHPDICIQDSHTPKSISGL